VRPAGFEPAA